MSFRKRHSWVNDKCVECGLRRKRVAVRAPLDYPGSRKWRTGFFYYRDGEHLEPTYESLNSPDCETKKTAQTVETQQGIFNKKEKRAKRF